MKSITWNGKTIVTYKRKTHWKVWLRYQVRRVIRTGAIAGTISCMMLGAMLYGQHEAGITVVNSQVMPTDLAPILHKIAIAESGDRHFAKNGQVLLHANTTGTYAGSVDIGRYGINNVAWGAQATKLNLNLFDEKDNEAMARWILNHYGSAPWYSSQGSWNNLK